MRVEKTKQGYVKLPDPLEQEIVSTLTKYLNGVKTGEKVVIPERDSLVQEIIKRMYPTTVQVATDITKREINIAIAKLLDALDLTGIIAINDIECITATKLIEEGDSHDVVLIPGDTFMSIRVGTISVKVNGMEQTVGTHYNYMIDYENNPDRLEGVDFGLPGEGDDIFEEGDVIEIQWNRTGKDRFSHIMI